jgi:hypothetical protein
MSQQSDSYYGSSHEGKCYSSGDEELLDDRSEEFAVEDYDFPRLASGTIASFGDDSNSPMTPSFREISEYACQDEEEQPNYQDSVGPLNEAFEKLDKCMERTAQTRAMLREKMGSQSQYMDWKSFVLEHLEAKLKDEANK